MFLCQECFCKRYPFGFFMPISTGPCESCHKTAPCASDLVGMDSQDLDNRGRRICRRMKPGTYKKIPRPVEAVQVRDLLEKRPDEWPLWAHALERRQLIGITSPEMKVGRLLEVVTIQGQCVAAGSSEWLLWDPESFEKRDVWPVQAKVFEETYERVES